MEKRTEAAVITKDTALVIGAGRIGARVAELMKHFIHVTVFDILTNKLSELKSFMKKADCVTIHIPNSDDNISFFDGKKLSSGFNFVSDGAI